MRPLALQQPIQLEITQLFDRMNESSTKSIEYASEAELLSEFKEHMCDPANIERATNYLYNALVEETVIGVAFELHYLHKTGLDVAIEGEPEDTTLYGTHTFISIGGVSISL